MEDIFDTPPLPVRAAEIGHFMGRSENDALADDIDDIIDELTNDNTDEELRGRLWCQIESLVFNALHARPKRSDRP